MVNSTQTTDVWWIGRGQQTFGPYSATVIDQWIQQGKIASDVLLSKGGNDWITVADFISRVAPPASPFLSDIPLPGITPDPAESAMVLTTNAAPEITEAEQEQEEETLLRDRIVILGRRSSGKTIYLASLYAMLWKRLDGLSAKALSGTVHKELMRVVDGLRQGTWPPHTQGSTQVEMEITHNGRKRLMVTLDFAGELFAKAFVHDQQHESEVKPLIGCIDRAAAVMLLVDPSVVAGQDRDAVFEDDFGIVQAVQRIHNWPGGSEVPIAVVLTKADSHQRLLDEHGGAVGFVRHFFPALVREMKQIPIFQVSAVQCVRDKDGKERPQRDSVQINIDKPLLYCLNKIDKDEREEEQRQAIQDAQRAQSRMEQAQGRKEQTQNRLLIAAVAGIFLIGLAVVGAILYYNR